MKKMIILLAAMAMSTLAVQAVEAQPVEMTIASDEVTVTTNANQPIAEDDKNTTKEAKPKN